MNTQIREISLWRDHGPQGETRYLTDESGNIADSYLYDAYGNPVFATNVYYNPHRYGGKYGYHSNLNPAGLVLAGARWYSPNLRRWMSRDPIGYDGGDNLFEYVDSSPTKWVDPLGLTAECPLNEFGCKNSPKIWKQYPSRIGACLFHCCGSGYVENRLPSSDNPSGECFYDTKGKLITSSCKGTPNQYDTSTFRQSLRHTFIDTGGIYNNFWSPIGQSIWHQLEAE